jgi:hypothetical protein
MYPELVDPVGADQEAVSDVTTHALVDVIVTHAVMVLAAGL